MSGYSLVLAGRLRQKVQSRPVSYTHLTGVILTKLDGDTRGGAALSVKSITGKPIKFAGMGEKMDALEPFYPDRMAGRILGMGDILTLIDKAQENINQAQAEEMSKKMLKAEFTFDDYLAQMEQMQNMGSLEGMLEMMPGMKSKLKDVKIDPKEMDHVKAIIRSMTPQERRNPKLINGSRRRRIALGSGTKVQDVNRLLKQYEQAQSLMKQFSKMPTDPKKMKKGFKLPFM